MLAISFERASYSIWCVVAGLTAVSSSEVLDIMFQDFPDQYEELRKNMRDKAARELIYKQKGLWLLTGRLKEINNTTQLFVFNYKTRYCDFNDLFFLLNNTL